MSGSSTNKRGNKRNHFVRTSLSVVNFFNLKYTEWIRKMMIKIVQLVNFYTN
jgi:hypothetical protein